MTSSFRLATAALWRREMIRFWREKTRVAGFVGSPLVFWLVIGSGFGNLGFFFPGALTLTVMFSAVFSMMSLIEDRREGFLLSVLVSPAPRLAVVAGKILGAGTLAWVQGVIFLCFLPLAGLGPPAAAVCAAAAVLLLISITFTALGFVIAWRMDSSQGFHAVINLLLFPLWMVSGALFGQAGAHGWIRWVMRLNPLTYALTALRRLLDPAGEPGAASLELSLAVTAACAVLLVAASAASAAKKSTRNLG